MVRALRACAAMALIAAAGCTGDGLRPEGPSWFRASLTGEVNRQYEGAGDFAVQRDHDDSPKYFKIHSQNTDAGGHQFFYFRWPNARRPSPGTYALVPHADEYGSPSGITAIYYWRVGDNVTAPASSELYVAAGGTVEITRSTAEEVEGTISFSGIRVSKWDAWGNGPKDPRNQPNPAAPKVQVSGTFRVVRFDEDAVIVSHGNHLRR